MQAEQSGETPTQLIELAAAKGYSVSREQLARWHRVDLLPPPSTPPLGKGQGPGTRTVYPPGTVDRLLDLCELREQYGPHTPLPRLAWLLWWKGHDIPLTRIRAFLSSTIAEHEKGMKELAAYFRPSHEAEGEEGELPDAAFDLLDRMQTSRTRMKPLRQMRKRVGTSNFPTLLRMIFEVGLGAFQIERYSNKEDRAIVTKAFGLKHAAWLDTDMLSSLQELSQWLHDHSLQDMLVEATDANLLQGRDELRTFLALLEQMSVIAGHEKGRRGQGLGISSEFVSLLKPAHRAPLLVTWASLRKAASPQMQQNMDAVLQAATQFLTSTSGLTLEANLVGHQPSDVQEQPV